MKKSTVLSSLQSKETTTLAVVVGRGASIGAGRPPRGDAHNGPGYPLCTFHIRINTRPFTVQYLCPQDVYYHQSNSLFSLVDVLDPVGEANISCKLHSNPKRLDLRIMQPVAVQLISTLGRFDICHAPAAHILRSHRDPLVVGRDLNV